MIQWNYIRVSAGQSWALAVVLRQEEPAKGKCIENINLYHFSM